MKKMIFFLSLATLLFAACAPIATPTPTPTVTPIPTATKPSTPLSLVAVGDSMPFNSKDDCPGCTGFVDRYGAEIQKTTGRTVNVQNLSQHDGLQIEGLLLELKDGELTKALANADIIVVSIAGNSTALTRGDDPCDGPSGNQPDWSMFTPACSVAAAEAQRHNFESVFSQIVAMRGRKPTVFRTVNMYNAWIGRDIPEMNFPPEAVNITHYVIDDWNKMVCKAAESNGFLCADVYHAFNGADGLSPATEFLGSGYNIHPSDKGNEVIASVLSKLGYAPIFP